MAVRRLRHLPRGKVGAYRIRLDEWLAPGGDYVLVHFAHRLRMFWVPKGPRHMTRDEAVAFFAPLELQAYDETHFRRAAPDGPDARRRLLVLPSGALMPSSAERRTGPNSYA